ncbi:MAG TPA: hypothetical protein VHF24_13690 [Acidimicrobiales bacterium]|nr:hypothetical protein [Acidimicrobiales bacterium]
MSLAALWVAAATVLQLVRAPDRPPWTAIWAEDGNVFLSQAIDDRLNLFEPHSGYLQLAARAVGSLAAELPLEHAAATFAVAGSFVVALLSVYVFFASRSVLGSAWARTVMAATFVFAPVTAFEVAANGLDIHWYLLFAAFLALWSTSDSGPMLVADAVVVAAATLSGPLTALYAPLAVRRVVVGEGRRRWVVPAVFAAAVACQAVAVLVEDAGDQRFLPFRLVDVPLGYALRVTGSVVVGDGYLSTAFSRFGWLFAVASVVVVGGVCLVGILQAGGERLAFMVAALFYSAVLFAVALYLRGSQEVYPARDSFTLNGSRYTVVPVLLLIAVLLCVAEGPPLRGRVWPPRAVAAAVVLVTLVNFRAVETVRSLAPDWGESMRAARQECARTGAGSVHVPVAPGPPELWYVDVPCDRI